MAKPSNRLLRRLAYALSRLRERRAFSFGGARFIVDVGVLNPTLFRASFILAEEALKEAPRAPCRVLELGSGCGLTAILLARRGHCVTAVDIDNRAVSNTVANAERNAVALRALVSDWDGSLSTGERFDLIVVNPPFLSEEPPSFRRALYSGPNHEALRASLAAAGRRLDSCGRVLALTSDRTLREALLSAAQGGGLRVVSTRRHPRWLDTYLTDILAIA